MSRLRPIAAAIGAGVRPTDQPHGRGRHPFITISRQAGAGGRTLMERLVDRLREIDPAPDAPWTGYDRELVEQVAREYHVSPTRIEHLGNQPHSWLDDLIRGLSPTAFTESEIAVTRHTAHTMHGLAERGRAIIVGRGGVLVTRDLPGGLHLHLVAPEQDRIAHLASRRGLSQDDAADQVRGIDANRQSFYRRYFPNRSLTPDLYTMTLNTSAMGDDAMVDVVVTAVHHVAAALT